MGNQSSQPSNDFQRQFQQLQDQVKRQQRQQHVDLNHLQKQIYHAQLKMQEMKQNYNPQQAQQYQQQRPQQYGQSQNNQNQYQQHQQQYPHQYPQQRTLPQQQNQPSNDLVNMQATNKLNSLLGSPDLKREMANNPGFGVQIIELILKEFGTQLSDSQYNKINEYLERANQQTHQQQQAQQLQLQYQQQQHQQQQQQVQLHRHANMNITQKYQSEEEEERERFEKEQERRRKEFEEQQSRRRNDYKNQMKVFESSQINAYSLLGIPQNYTMDQLKIAYRKKAIMTHPDKGGSPELFDEVTKAYFSLLEKLKNKESDKQFLDLKSQSKNYIEKQSGDNRQNINLEKMTVSKESFNVKAFNKIFEENKIADANDDGYSDWMKDESNVKEPPKVFSTKFNLDVFNSTFENWKDKDEHLSRENMEIVVRSEPQALVLSKTGYSELGVDTINDFSKSDINARNLGYTDLKQAYSRNGIMNTKSITPRESYKNIQEYEKARANVSYQMSDEDIRRQEMKKKKEEEEEALRVQRVQNRDNMHFNSYNRVHQLMLDKLK
jgi:hypothetical protein